MDNFKEFEYNQVKYRVRLPTKKEKMEVEEARSTKLLEMLMTPKVYRTKKAWIKLYKESQDIDIEEKENQIKKWAEEAKKFYNEITEAKNEDLKKTLEKDIEDLFNKVQSLQNEIDSLLENCIETKLTEYGNNCLTVKMFEKLVGDQWVPVFKNYEDLLSLNDEFLLSEAKHYIRNLISPIQI